VPHPTAIASALPANLRSGKPAGGGDFNGAVVAFLGAGPARYGRAWARRCAGRLAAIRGEAGGGGCALGQVRGSRWSHRRQPAVPLPQLEARTAELPKDQTRRGALATPAVARLWDPLLLHGRRPQVANLRGVCVLGQAMGYPHSRRFPQPRPTADHTSHDPQTPRQLPQPAQRAYPSASVDVRERFESSSSGRSRAANLPLSRLAAQLPPRGPLVLVFQSGSNAARRTAELLRAGNPARLTDLRAVIDAWQRRRLARSKRSGDSPALIAPECSRGRGGWCFSV